MIGQRHHRIAVTAQHNTIDVLNGDAKLHRDERFDALPGGSDDIRRLELQRDLVRAMEGLSDEQRDVILLHDAEGYSAAEVASILDISAGTVKSRLHRARAHLKNFLGEGTF